eukprot:scaffold66935_cov52-Attheya_sp.AAC.2
MRGLTSLRAMAVLLLMSESCCDAFVPASTGRHAVLGRSSTMRLSMEPLAQEGEWTAYRDDQTTGLVYYFNGRTGESLWEPPTSTFPPVVLDSASKERVISKQQEYVAATTVEQDQEESPKKGLFGLFAKRNNNAEPKEAVQEESSAPQEKKGLFRMFRRNSENIEDEGAVAVDGSSEVASARSTFAFPDFFNTAKEEDLIIPSDKPIQIEMSSNVLPHPEKMSWGGEDAAFTNGRTFGIFDGVSGAEKLDGVALYSTTLSKQMKQITGSDGLTIQELTGMLEEAADVADDKATGASTAVIASIGEDGYLRALNLGDSVVLVIREGKIVARSKEIVHYFDCPYQLAESSPDRPKDGTKLKTQVMPGDIVLAGSDGIFDNLSEDDICKIVAASPNKAHLIAKKVVDESRSASLNLELETPYAKLAKKAKYAEYKSGRGGKVDDISCVVVRCT